MITKCIIGTPIKYYLAKEKQQMLYRGQQVEQKLFHLCHTITITEIESDRIIKDGR